MLSKYPKITVVTVVKNGNTTIERCLSSLAEQSYPNLEKIVIDGASTDGTLVILDRFRELGFKVFSEQDLGIYDALNKGIVYSTGEIIGLLHGDDYLPHANVIKNIADEFKKHIGSHILIGRLAYFHPYNMNKIVRKYFPASFRNWMFHFGIAPPHPAFYAKRELFDEYGSYRTDLEIAGDFDLMLRLLYIYKVPYKCIGQNWVMMSTGGKSTSGWSSIIKNNKEILRVCRGHQFYTNYFLIYMKYLIKLFGIR